MQHLSNHEFFELSRYFDDPLMLKTRGRCSLVVNKMCEKGEHNYVADAQNWEQRIKGEIEAARVRQLCSSLTFIKCMVI